MKPKQGAGRLRLADGQVIHAHFEWKGDASSWTGLVRRRSGGRPAGFFEGMIAEAKLPDGLNGKVRMIQVSPQRDSARFEGITPLDRGGRTAEVRMREVQPRRPRMALHDAGAVSQPRSG